MKIKLKYCHYCDTSLSHDELGLNKKLLESEVKRGHSICLECMSKMFDCTIEDLKYKIEDFKREGCKLFG